MMKRTRAVLALLAALVLPISAGADGTKTTTLVATYDLEGAAASAAGVVADSPIADSNSYAIAGQPDQPRPLVLTITDADASCTAGTVTIAGKDSNGKDVTAVGTFAGGGSGTLTLVYSAGFSGNFASVTSVTTSAITGEGGAADKMSVGTSSTIPYVFPNSVGRTLYDVNQNYTVRDFWAWREVNIPVVTSGTPPSTLTAVTASTNPFLRVGVGDLLQVVVDGYPYEVRVTAKASDDQVTISQAFVMPAAGSGFYHRARWIGADDEGWYSMRLYRRAQWTVQIAQMNVTGGINIKVECRQIGAGISPTIVFSDVALAANTYTYTLGLGDLGYPGYDQCRVGLQPVTNDDANDLTTNTEQITIQLAVETR